MEDLKISTKIFLVIGVMAVVVIGAGGFRPPSNDRDSPHPQGGE